MGNKLRGKKRQDAYHGGAEKLTSALMAAVGVLRGELRTRFARPPEETPNADVLLKVGHVVKVCKLATDLALQHRAAINTAVAASGRRDELATEVLRLQRALAAVNRRADHAESELRRLNEQRGT